MLRALLVLTWVLVSPGEVRAQVSTAVRNELAVREAALFPERGDGSAGGDWRARYAALEAIARRAPGSITENQRELAAASLDDEHPNVRASALLVHARHALVLPAPAQDLAQDPLPSVRLNLARAAAHLPGGPGDQLLLGLSEDGDASVAAEARAQLLARGEASLEAQLTLFEQDPPRLDAQRFLDALDVLYRAPSNDVLLRSIRDRLHEEKAATGGTDDLRAKWALCEALALARGDVLTLPSEFEGYFDDFGETQGAAVDLRPDETWYPGAGLPQCWLSPLAGETPVLRRRRRQWLLRAASSNPYSHELARALLDQAWALERPLWKADLEPDAAALLRGRVDQLRRDAIEIHFSGASVHFADSGPAFLDPGWDKSLLLEYLQSAAQEMDVWGEGPRQLLSSEDPDLAEAACDAVLDTWNRKGDADSARLAIEALERPLLSEQVYRSLVGSQRPMPSARVVCAWWRSQSLEKRVELLGEHSRAPRFEPWRDALLDLWATGASRTVSIPELLAAFEGDDEVRWLLWYWLLQEIRLLEAGEVPDEETTRGPWREAEARALWLLKAWTKVSRGEYPTPEALLLGRVGQRGKELGKHLVAHMVKTEAGRRATLAAIERAELSRRLRFEVLLVNPDLTTPDELLELFVAYATCDDELKLRILKRGAGLDDELVRALLCEVALDLRASPALRQQAVESLTRAGPPERTLPLLTRVLVESGDYETKRGAIAALGQVARDWRSLGLLELYRDETQRELLGDELLPALVRIELRGTGALGEELTRLWRARADEPASAELDRRFRGERLAAREFEYKGWLAAAGALAEAGQLEAALGQRWWTWDGRLLMHLAHSVRGTRSGGSSELARRLDRGALVALLGEGEAADRPGLVVRCRARLLHGALAAKDWGEAHGWVRVLLDDWRTGRTTPNAIQSVFGSHDRETVRDPLHRLLTLEVTTRAWSALARGDIAGARELARRAGSLTRYSAAAREHLAELERAIAEHER